MNAIVIWGNQLTVDHHSALQAEPKAPVIMIESKGISTKFKYHKQKLWLVFTAMREFADELKASGRTLHYVCLEDGQDNWHDSLQELCSRLTVDRLTVMRPNDRGPHAKLEQWCKRQKIELVTTPNELFLTPTAAFTEWAESQKRLHMEQFYRWQRQRLDILVQPNGKPVGGKWNYDAENRKPLPKDTQPPKIQLPKPSKYGNEVKQLVEEHFADHPGALDTLWMPTTRRQARAWLKQFIDTRFNSFGDYEDAMRPGEPFLYHSVLSPVMNIGLLHASEVIDAALKADVPLAAKEGFIRQIIGWREFMFGLYHYLPTDWIDSNFLGHTKKLEPYWWQLEDAPEPPLQDVFDRLKTYGYNHHIERLMVLGNYMLLSGYAPREVYDWFMTMYVDAYEWVMVPNVIGMSQFADGGLDNGGFATKPYISGSNYLQKMGRWWPSQAAAKDSDWTERYWKFLNRHEKKLARNYRLAPLFRAAKTHSKNK